MMRKEDLFTTQTIILSSLSTLPQSHLSILTKTITADLHRNHRRVAAILSSPILFSETLRRLNSLDFLEKTHLLSRHLLFSLHRLTLFFTITQPRPLLYRMRLHDHDVVLLLLLLCQLHQHNPEALIKISQVNWRLILIDFFLDSILSISEINGVGLIRYVELVAKCLRLVRTDSGAGYCRKVGTSPATVVSLPSVAVKGAAECVICREEMREGRDVCKLPCQHLFHWLCILPWLKKRSTCPCCRFQLPSDDVYCEIQRLWNALVDASGWEARGE